MINRKLTGDLFPNRPVLVLTSDGEWNQASTRFQIKDVLGRIQWAPLSVCTDGLLMAQEDAEVCTFLEG